MYYTRPSRAFVSRNKNAEPYEPMPYVKGYFAFPPPGFEGHPDAPFVRLHEERLEQAQRAREEKARVMREAEEREQENERLSQEQRQREAEQHEEAMATFRELAMESEIMWVRRGCSIRDRFGRVNVEYTEMLRAEIRVRDEEERRLKPWNAYEARWVALFASSEPVAFKDIPWPLPDTPSSVDELTDTAIEEFMFASLNFRKNTTTRRDRLKASILRWHPDKLSSVLARVVLDDDEAVREGVNMVFRRLRVLQDAERQVS